jgi:hypothetical protein
MSPRIRRMKMGRDRDLDRIRADIRKAGQARQRTRDTEYNNAMDVLYTEYRKLDLTEHLPERKKAALALYRQAVQKSGIREGLLPKNLEWDFRALIPLRSPSAPCRNRRVDVPYGLEREEFQEKISHTIKDTEELEAAVDTLHRDLDTFSRKEWEFHRILQFFVPEKTEGNTWEEAFALHKQKVPENPEEAVLQDAYDCYRLLAGTMAERMGNIAAIMGELKECGLLVTYTAGQSRYEKSILPDMDRYTEPADITLRFDGPDNTGCISCSTDMCSFWMPVPSAYYDNDLEVHLILPYGLDKESFRHIEKYVCGGADVHEDINGGTEGLLGRFPFFSQKVLELFLETEGAFYGCLERILRPYLDGQEPEQAEENGMELKEREEQDR